MFARLDYSYLAIRTTIALSCLLIAVCASPARAQEPLVIKNAGNSVIALAYSPDGKVLASGMVRIPSVKFWNPATGELIGRGRGTIVEGPHRTRCSALAYSPDGKWMASGGKDPNALLWNADERKVTKRFSISYPGADVAWLPDSSHVAISHALAISIFSVKPGASKGYKSIKGSFNALAVRSDGRQIAAVDRYGKVSSFDPVTGRSAWSTNITRNVDDLEYSPDGKLLAVAIGSTEARLLLLDAATGDEVATIADALPPVAFSPNGGIIASGGPKRVLKLWDVSTRKEIAELKGHEKGVVAVAFCAGW